MTFGERPVAAEAVFDEQQLRSVVLFAIDQSATGFFMLHDVSLLWFCSAPTKGARSRDCPHQSWRAFRWQKPRRRIYMKYYTMFCVRMKCFFLEFFIFLRIYAKIAETRAHRSVVERIRPSQSKSQRASRFSIQYSISLENCLAVKT